MKMFLLLVVFTPLLSAQSQIVGPPTQFRKVTVAGLPASPSTGTTVQVTNGASGSDCATGGGTTKVWCTWTGAAWQAMSGSGGGSGTELTAAATPGADNTVMRSVGNARAMEGTGCTITDSNQMSCTGGVAAAGVAAGLVALYEASASGSDAITRGAPDSVSASYRMNDPADPPTVAGQTLRSGTPSGGITQYTHAMPLWAAMANANSYFDWTLGSAPGNPGAGDIRVYPKTGSTICVRDSAGTETCFGSGSGSSTKTYTFQGINQGDVPGWNLNWRTLTNMVFSTLDASNLRSLITVTANTTGSDMWSVTPITTTNPTVRFVASVRSTDATNAGSIALAYACVPSGDSVNNPSYTSLTALSLTTIDPDSEVFNSSQAVTCTGTESAPADLYVKWTPTAPSGGTLSLIALRLIY